MLHGLWCSYVLITGYWSRHEEIYWWFSCISWYGATVCCCGQHGRYQEESHDNLVLSFLKKRRDTTSCCWRRTFSMKWLWDPCIVPIRDRSVSSTLWIKVRSYWYSEMIESSTASSVQIIVEKMPPISSKISLIQTRVVWMKLLQNTFELISEGKWCVLARPEQTSKKWYSEMNVRRTTVIILSEQLTLWKQYDRHDIDKREKTRKNQRPLPSSQGPGASHSPFTHTTQ